jgi:hypothetical protein
MSRDVTGRTGSKEEREDRAARIAELHGSGESPSAIAEAVGLSKRQVQRVVNRLDAETVTGTLAPLPVPGPRAINPVGEMAQAVAVLDQVEAEARNLVTNAREESTKVAALKMLSQLATSRLDLLARMGALPPGPQWLDEVKALSAWEAALDVAEEAGLDRAVVAAAIRQRLESAVRPSTQGLLQVGPLALGHRGAVAA